MDWGSLNLFSIGFAFSNQVLSTHSSEQPRAMIEGIHPRLSTEELRLVFQYQLSPASCMQATAAALRHSWHAGVDLLAASIRSSYHTQWQTSRSIVAKEFRDERSSTLRPLPA
jgi:hypothetical protein